VGKALEGLQHDVDADAVIERLARVEVAHLDELALQRDRVTDAHQLLDLLGGEPDVDEELFDGDDLGALLRGGQVSGFDGDDAIEDALAVDLDALGNERARVEPAERVEVQEAVLVNVAHDEGDLVHVRGEHDFAPPLTGAAPQSKEVAHDVGVELIGVRGKLALQQFTQRLLATGDGGR
jgi:hypothetical protein